MPNKFIELVENANIFHGKFTIDVANLLQNKDFSFENLGVVLSKINELKWQDEDVKAFAKALNQRITDEMTSVGFSETILKYWDKIQDFADSNDDLKRKFELQADLYSAGDYKIILEDKFQHGASPLHDAAKIVNTIGDRFYNLIERANDRKKLINSQDKYGMTALHYVALVGNVEAAKKLIANGANVDLKDRQGRTYLECARDATENKFLAVMQPNQNVPQEKKSSGFSGLLSSAARAVKEDFLPSALFSKAPLRFSAAAVQGIRLIEKFMNNEQLYTNVMADTYNKELETGKPAISMPDARIFVLLHHYEKTENNRTDVGRWANEIVTKFDEKYPSGSMNEDKIKLTKELHDVYIKLNHLKIYEDNYKKSLSEPDKHIQRLNLNIYKTTLQNTSKDMDALLVRLDRTLKGNPAYKEISHELKACSKHLKEDTKRFGPPQGEEILSQRPSAK